MVTAQPTSIESCPYCGVSVGEEKTYRRHLYDAHDPSELGAIDRRRYEHYRPEPSVVVRTGVAAIDALYEFRYPVDTQTAVEYAVYGAVCSVSVAILLGVGL